MDLKTLSAIFVQQTQNAMDINASIESIANMVIQLANQENSAPGINPQVKSYMGTANIYVAGINSQLALLQQTIDAISALVAS